MKKFLYKIFKYDEFKDSTTSKKFDMLFWELALLELLFLFLVVSLSISRVKAEELEFVEPLGSDFSISVYVDGIPIQTDLPSLSKKSLSLKSTRSSSATYINVSANSCIMFDALRSNGTVYKRVRFSPSTDSRLAIFYTGSRYDWGFLSETQGVYYQSSTSTSSTACGTQSNNMGSQSIGNLRYYGTSFSFLSVSDVNNGYDDLSTTNIPVNDTSTIEWKQYLYGSSAVAPSSPSTASYLEVPLNTDIYYTSLDYFKVVSGSDVRYTLTDYMGSGDSLQYTINLVSESSFTYIKNGFTYTSTDSSNFYKAYIYVYASDLVISFRPSDMTNSASNVNNLTFGSSALSGGTLEGGVAPSYPDGTWFEVPHYPDIIKVCSNNGSDQYYTNYSDDDIRGVVFYNSPFYRLEFVSVSTNQPVASPNGYIVSRSVPSGSPAPSFPSPGNQGNGRQFYGRYVYNNNYFYTSYNSSLSNSYAWSNVFVPFVSGVGATTDLTYRYTFGDLNIEGEGSSVISRFDIVRRFLPVENNETIAFFSSAVVNGNYEQIPDNNYVAMYISRYNKSLNILYNYRVVFEDDPYYPIVYTKTSDNKLVLQFSSKINTSNGGTTSIFVVDKNRYWTTTDLSNVDEILDPSSWQSYNRPYSDIESMNPSFWQSLFGQTYKGESYSNFNMSNFLTFDIKTSNSQYLDLNGNPIKFFTSVNESSEYYDYYVLLSFRSEKYSSVASEFYNNGNTYYIDSETGNRKVNFSYYSIIEYINQKMNFEDFEGDEFVNIDDYVDGTVSNVDDIPILNDPNEYVNQFQFTEDEYITKPAVDAFTEFFDSLVEFVFSDMDHYQYVLNQISYNEDKFLSALDSMQDPSLNASVLWVSEELDWVYNNTILKVPIDIGLVSAVIWGILF